MEGPRNIFLPLLLAVVVASIHRKALAAKHNVGGSQGWDESTDFDTWASAQTFQVGDELEFKYIPGLHSVVELSSESAYKSCDIGSSVKSLNGGGDTIKLDKPNTRYFACGTSGHCEAGMKVKITTTVAADGSSTTTSQPSSPAASTHSTSGASHQLQPLCSFALLGFLLLFI